MKRYEAAGGRHYVCPICFTARKLDEGQLIGGAELQGTVPLWNWIGDEAATTFSYRPAERQRRPPCTVTREGAPLPFNQIIEFNTGRIDELT